MRQQACIVKGCDKHTRYLAGVCQLHGGNTPSAYLLDKLKMLERIKELENELYRMKKGKQK